MLERFHGVFERLLGLFLSGLVIFLAVMYSGSAIRMGGKFGKFRSSLVRITRHRPVIPEHNGRAFWAFRMFNWGHSRWRCSSALFNCSTCDSNRYQGSGGYDWVSLAARTPYQVFL